MSIIRIENGNWIFLHVNELWVEIIFLMWCIRNRVTQMREQRKMLDR